MGIAHTYRRGTEARTARLLEVDVDDHLDGGGLRTCKTTFTVQPRELTPLQRFVLCMYSFTSPGGATRNVGCPSISYCDSWVLGLVLWYSALASSSNGRGYLGTLRFLEPEEACPNPEVTNL